MKKATKEEIVNMMNFLSGEEYDREGIIHCWCEYAPSSVDEGKETLEHLINSNEDKLRKINDLEFPKSELFESIRIINTRISSFKEDMKMLLYVAWLSTFNGYWIEIKNGFLLQEKIEYDFNKGLIAEIRYKAMIANSNHYTNGKIGLKELVTPNFDSANYKVVFNEEVVSMLEKAVSAADEYKKLIVELKKIAI